jgi:hypothetical protein
MLDVIQRFQKLASTVPSSHRENLRFTERSRRFGIAPTPKRCWQMNWAQFIHTHMPVWFRSATPYTIVTPSSAALFELCFCVMEFRQFCCRLAVQI